MLVTNWQLEIVPNQHEISPQIIKKFEVPGNWYWPHQVKHQCSCPAFHLLCHCHFLNPIFQSWFLSKQKAMSFEHTIPSCAFLSDIHVFFIALTNSTHSKKAIIKPIRRKKDESPAVVVSWNVSRRVKCSFVKSFTCFGKIVYRVPVFLCKLKRQVNIDYKVSFSFFYY